MLRTYASRLVPAIWFLAWLFSVSQSGSPSGLRSILSVFVCGLGLIGGLYLFLRGFRLLAWKRYIEDTPITKIAAAAVGNVKVFGKAAGPYTIISPLAAVDCYYYRAITWDGRDAQDLETSEGRVTETLFTPLFVQDETGTIMIDPRGARLEFPPDYEEQICSGSMAESSRRFLHRHALTDVGDTTVTEYAIKPGDPLLVLGCLSPNPGLGTIGEHSGTKGTYYLSREAADLQRYEQYDAQGVRDPELTARPTGVAIAFDEHPSMLLSAGDRRNPFVLSRQTPQRIINDLARRSTLSIWGGPVLTLLSLALLLKHLGSL